MRTKDSMVLLEKSSTPDEEEEEVEEEEEKEEEVEEEVGVEFAIGVSTIFPPSGGVADFHQFPARKPRAKRKTPTFRWDKTAFSLWASRLPIADESESDD